MKTFKLLFTHVLILSVAFVLMISCGEDDSTEMEIPPPTQLDIAQVDDDVNQFLSENGVPGASLAVSIDGNMVYSKGYGKSNIETDTDTKKTDVFRIASISKVFTSTAIMALVDDGLLSLDEKVFGAEGILGNDFGSATISNNELEITVDDLLLHQQGGWFHSSGYDIIDYEPNLAMNEFLEYIFNNSQTLPPGENFRYNNTGYWLLARIIEEVSGKTYEAYLTSLLEPVGITTFKTTTFRENDREPNEVEYYGNSSDAPYIYTIASRRDGDAGVVISAPDLLRFLNAIDGSPTRPDIISSSSQDLLESTTSLSNLGRGLAVWEQQNLTYFTGSLPGNRSWFMIHSNGRIATILLNYRNSQNANFDTNFQNLLLTIVKDNSIPWQTDLDQF